MLRCRMHIRVSAEPMSLVAPGGEQSAADAGQGHPHTSPSLVCMVGAGWLLTGTIRAGMHWALGTLYAGGSLFFSTINPQIK